MVTYYNLTKFSEAEGLMGTFRVINDLMSGIFGFTIQFVIFVVAVMIYTRTGEDVNRSIHLASSYTLIIGILFYIAQINTNSLGVWIPALIYVVTLGIRWYNR